MPDMEAPPQRFPASPSTAPPDVHAPPDRRTGGRNPVQRIGSQTRALFGDVTSWIELRLRLFQLEVQERIQRKVDEAIIKVAPVVVGILAGFFALITMALFVGWALGHPAWGFLVVTGLLLLVAGLLYARSRRLGREGQEVDISPSPSDGRARGGAQ
jgi:uncharacterized membrane protein YqjE